jgi:hypothetical protein
MALASGDGEVDAADDLGIAEILPDRLQLDCSASGIHSGIHAVLP